MTAAVVLAAGASLRLGRPKALLDFDGRTALELVLAALAESGVRTGALVVGEHAGEILQRVASAPLTAVRNSAPEAGRMGSLLVALAHVPADADLLIWPVDRPLASAATVRALLETIAGVGSSAEVIVPETAGRRGHPILVGAGLRSVLLASSPDASLREVLRAAARRQVPVADSGIHFDLDTRADYARALAWWRER